MGVAKRENSEIDIIQYMDDVIGLCSRFISVN